MSKSEPSKFTAAKTKEDTFTYGCTALVIAAVAATIVIFYLGSGRDEWLGSAITASLMFAAAALFAAMSLRSLLNFLEAVLEQQLETKSMSYR